MAGTGKEISISGKFAELEFCRSISLHESGLSVLRDFGIWDAGIAVLKGPHCCRRGVFHEENTIMWFVLSGSVSIEYKGKVYECKPGDLWIRNGNDEETVSFPDEKFEHIFFKLSQSPGENAGLRKAVKLPELQMLMNFLYFESLEKHPDSGTTLSSISVLIVNILRRNMGDFIPPKFGDIHKLLEENPKAFSSTAKLAAHFHVSPSLLYKLCRKHYGRAPKDLIASVRMRRMENLIRFTDESLDKIAETLGYSSAFALSKAYHQYCGKRPGQIRREFWTHTRNA